MTYLDTNAVFALDRKEADIFSRRAQAAIDREDDLRISPMVLLELEYLHEIKRIKGSAAAIVNDLQAEIGLRVCDSPFPLVVHKALAERWTRDPFDRMIVAHARLYSAPLITLDRNIQDHYTYALG
jgi:PIN domain nuclease of toxin-antitoxin system